MSRILWIVGGVVVFAVASIAVSRMLGSTSDDFSSDPGLDSPLPACAPGMLNCVRVSRRVNLGPDAALQQAQQALADIGAASIETDSDARRLDAVFNAFVFQDDVAIIITPDADGSALHLRSSSRVGKSDLGVNRRRVRSFLATFGIEN